MMPTLIADHPSVRMIEVVARDTTCTTPISTNLRPLE
jgi:hypothetical protein